MIISTVLFLFNVSFIKVKKHGYEMAIFKHIHPSREPFKLKIVLVITHLNNRIAKTSHVNFHLAFYKVYIDLRVLKNIPGFLKIK